MHRIAHLANLSIFTYQGVLLNSKGLTSRKTCVRLYCSNQILTVGYNLLSSIVLTVLQVKAFFTAQHKQCFPTEIKWTQVLNFNRIFAFVIHPNNIKHKQRLAHCVSDEAIGDFSLPGITASPSQTSCFNRQWFSRRSLGSGFTEKELEENDESLLYSTLLQENAKNISQSTAIDSSP